MKFKELGRTGEKLSCIGIGTWKLGYNIPEEIAAIKAGIDEGINFIDTAEMYNTENIVSDAIKGEKGLFIATKVSPHNLSYEDVIRACNNSLKRLEIKAIDLYQVHWPNDNIPISETMRAMERLVKEGKIRYIGVSNFTVAEFREAQEALKNNDIVSDQVEYNVFVRDPEAELTGFCKDKKASIIAYSPLASGKMFDKQRASALNQLDRIGAKYGKTGSQVALNWLVSKGAVIPIAKASSAQHMRENANASGFMLSKEDIRKIDTIDDSGIRPLASHMNAVARATASFWSKLTQRRESWRSSHKI